MNALTKTDGPHEIMETVLIKGDLSRLTPEERNSYYSAVCTSVGLNPLTKPFEYITLNGKLRLYALKDCTDQLRSIHGISVTELAESEREGVFVVKAKVANAQGRTDVSTGAVNISGLKGEALANALMKAETKAKRRATLSICGLGLLDETEVEDIPEQAKTQAPRDSGPPRQASPVVRQIEPPKEDAPPPPKRAPDARVQPEGTKPHKIVGGTYESWTTAYIEAVQSSDDPSVVMAWVDANAAQLDKLAKGSPDNASRAKAATAKHIEFLRKTAPKADSQPSGGQPSLLSDMGGEDSTPEPKPTRGRPRGSGKAPDFAKNYDGWLTWQLEAVAKAETPDAIEALYEAMDPIWSDIMPPDREALLGARREAESKLEQ